MTASDAQRRVRWQDDGKQARAEAAETLMPQGLALVHQGDRFIQRYRSGFPENLGEEFDAPFVRLDWISPDRFDIQWHRHTGAWYRLYRGQTLVQALKTIETDGHLHPL